MTPNEAAAVKRYMIEICNCEVGPHIEPVANPYGVYVTFDDHQQALQDAQRRGLQRYREAIAHELQLDNNVLHHPGQFFNKTAIIVALDKAEERLEQQATPEAAP
jgi:hypothetical protein